MKNFDSVIIPLLCFLLTFLLGIQPSNGNGNTGNGNLLFSIDSKTRKNNDPLSFFNPNLLNSMRSQKFRFGLGQQFYEEVTKDHKHFNFINNGECGGTLEANKGRLTYEKKARSKEDAHNSNSKTNINNHGNCIWILKLETADPDEKSRFGSKEKTGVGVENGIVVTIDRLRLNLQSTISFYLQEELMSNSDFPKPITFRSLTDSTATYKSKINPIMRTKGQTLIVVLTQDPSDTESSSIQLHWDSDTFSDPQYSPSSSSFSSSGRDHIIPITTANYVVPAKNSGHVLWNSYEFHLQQRSTWILNARKHDETLSSACSPLIPVSNPGHHLNLNLSVDIETENEFQAKSSSPCERMLDEAREKTDSFLLDSCERASFQLFEILNGGRLRRVVRHCRGSLNLNVPNLTSQLVAFIQTSSTKEFGMPVKSVEISWEVPTPQQLNNKQEQNHKKKKPAESAQRKKDDSRPKISNQIIKLATPTPTQTVFLESTTTKKTTTTTAITPTTTTTTTTKKPTTITTTTTTRQPTKRVITTTKPTSPPSPFLETNHQFQIQLQRLPPIKLHRCPSPSIISPCTCSLFTGEVHAECSGKNIEQKMIDNLFSQLRRVNKIPTGRFMILAKIRITNTQLTQLDIIPFFGLEMKMFDVSFNKNFRRFLVAGRSLSPSGQNKNKNNNKKTNQNSNVNSNSTRYWHYNPKIPIPVPKIPLIRAKKLRLVDNALTDSGFGTLLHYFSPVMEELILYKNKLGGNSHNDDADDESMVNSDIPFFPGLSSLTKLSSVYLGSNQIHRLRRGQFKNNTRLLYLSIPGNGLTILDPMALSFNKPLVSMINQTLRIDLSRNNLNQTGFPRNHGLNEIGRPIYLDLDENKFESLSRDIFESFFMTKIPIPIPNSSQHQNQVNQVTFRDCPIFCDSRLGWLKKLRARLGKIVLNANCVNEPNRSIFTSRLVNIIKFVDKTQIVNETKVQEDFEF